MKRTLTTTEAAWFAGVEPRSFTRWARHRGITPLHRVRIGRSTITVWSVRSLLAATHLPARLDQEAAAC